MSSPTIYIKPSSQLREFYYLLDVCEAEVERITPDSPLEQVLWYVGALPVVAELTKSFGKGSCRVSGAIGKLKKELKRRLKTEPRHRDKILESLRCLDGEPYPILPSKPEEYIAEIKSSDISRMDAIDARDAAVKLEFLKYYGSDVDNDLLRRLHEEASAKCKQKIYDYHCEPLEMSLEWQQYVNTHLGVQRCFETDMALLYDVDHLEQYSDTELILLGEYFKTLQDVGQKAEYPYPRSAKQRAAVAKLKIQDELLDRAKAAADQAWTVLLAAYCRAFEADSQRIPGHDPLDEKISRILADPKQTAGSPWEDEQLALFNSLFLSRGIWIKVDEDRLQRVIRNCPDLDMQIAMCTIHRRSHRGVSNILEDCVKRLDTTSQTADILRNWSALRSFYAYSLEESEWDDVWPGGFKPNVSQKLSEMKLKNFLTFLDDVYVSDRSPVADLIGLYILNQKKLELANRFEYPTDAIAAERKLHNLGLRLRDRLNENITDAEAAEIISILNGDLSISKEAANDYLAKAYEPEITPENRHSILSLSNALYAVGELDKKLHTKFKALLRRDESLYANCIAKCISISALSAPYSPKVFHTAS